MKISTLRAIFIFLFLCVLSAPLKGLARTARFFSDPKMVTSSYNAITMDKEGFIWIGTNNGLIRFDGNNYDIYKHDDNDPGSISDNRVLNILADSKGRIWVGTANGLNLYDPLLDSFKLMKLPSISFGGYIGDSTERTDGTVTFIVSGFGLFIIDDSSGEPVAVRDLSLFSDASNFNTLLSTSNRLYIGCTNGMVYSVEPNSQIIPIFNAESYIKGIAREKSGSILIATVADIYRYNPYTGETKLLNFGPYIEINDISNRHDSIIYIATKDSGLWQITPDSDTPEPTFDIRSSTFRLSDSRISNVYVAADGNLWLGCNNHGLILVPSVEEPFSYHSFTDIDPSLNGVLQTMTHWNGNILAGLDNGQILLFSPEGKEIQKWRVPGGGAISSIKVEKDMAYLGVSNNGVWTIDLKTNNLSRHLPVPGKYMFLIIGPTIGDDTYLAVHGSDIYRHDHSSGQLIQIGKNNEGENLVNPFINTIAYFDGKLYMGHYDGIDLYDLSTKSFIGRPHPELGSMTVFSIVPVSEELILIGSSKGLIHYNPKENSIKYFTTADGLSDNSVRAIAVDKKGRRWIATMQGLSLQHPEDNRIDTYYGGYGLVDKEFFNIIPDEKGNKIYLGSSLGVSTIETDSLPSPGLSAPPTISAIMHRGKRIKDTGPQGEHPFILGKDGQPDMLKLPFKDNSIILRLSMMNFRDPSNLSYMWRFGRKGDWNRLASGEELIYLYNLEPGKHIVQIRAEENNTISPVNELIINVSYPWYLSPLAKIIIILFLAASIFLVFLIIRKKRQEKLNDEKFKYFIDTSHDIRSPVTMILDPLENLMKQPFDSETKSKFRIMHRNALRINSLVNQMLDLRKLEKGKMPLVCQPTDFNEYVKELVDMYSAIASERNLSISYECDVEFPQLWIDRNNFDKILVNLLSNAVKYTPAGGNILVRVSRVNDPQLGDAAEVSVIDTGIGLDDKTEKLMFQRFYRSDVPKAHSSDGTGIGLNLCQRLAILHHGTISGANRKDGVKGSIFTVRIPVNPDKYADNEKVRNNHSVELEVHPTRKLVSREINSSDLEESSAERKKHRGVSGHILIVDDDRELRNYLHKGFMNHYSIAEAEDGLEALKAIHNKRPDLIICDVMMPKMDGLTLLRQVKSNSLTSHIPVILLSSRNDVTDRMTGWEKGADAYLGKPFNMEELQTVADTLLFNRLRLKGSYSGIAEQDDLMEAPQVKGNDQNLLERIRKVTKEHIDDSSFNVESLSSEVGISRAHLHRRMKELMGVTPVDFIRNVRLRRACELLKKTDIEVTQVAYTLGYGSQSHFSTTFKKFTGFTPTEYREKFLAGEIMPDFGTELDSITN